MGKIAGRLAAVALSVAAAVLLSGCGKGKVPLTGTVKVEDKLVRSGQLTFLGPDGKKYLTTIGLNGKYTIELPPAEYKVGVEPPKKSPQAMMAGGGPSTSAPKVPKGVTMTDPTGQVKGESVDPKELQNPVVIPIRYRIPDSSNLTVTVTGSNDTFDIVMKKAKG